MWPPYFGGEGFNTMEITISCYASFRGTTSFILLAAGSEGNPGATILTWPRRPAHGEAVLSLERR